MIALLLILVPLISGLLTFFLKPATARWWTLLAAVGTLIVSVLGLTLFKDEKYLQFSSEWMPTLHCSFSLKLDGMSQLLCLLNAIAYPLVMLATWRNNYSKAQNFFALMVLAQAGMMGVFLAADAL